MHPTPALRIRIMAALVFLAPSITLSAQIASHLSTITPNLARTEGTDNVSGIAYARLYVSATPSIDTATLDLGQPTLTAQCTRRPDGKQFFELFVNFTGATDTEFHRPWTSADGGLFAPRTDKVILTMDFLGYTKVKPMRRQWERISPEGELRYTPPGGGSSNMEQASYFFQYLRSLPTLRLTGDGHAASFLTTSLQAQLHKEPLCSAVVP